MPLRLLLTTGVIPEIGSIKSNGRVTLRQKTHGLEVKIFSTLLLSTITGHGSARPSLGNVRVAAPKLRQLVERARFLPALVRLPIGVIDSQLLWVILTRAVLLVISRRKPAPTQAPLLQAWGLVILARTYVALPGKDNRKSVISGGVMWGSRYTTFPIRYIFLNWYILCYAILMS